MDHLQQLLTFRHKRALKESTILVGDADNKIARHDAIEQFYYRKAMLSIEDLGQRIYQESNILTAKELLAKLQQNTSV